MMIKVHKHGSVSLDGVFGDESTIVNAARVSTGGASVTRSILSKKDLGLIDFLFDNGHMTPFEHVVFRFNVEAPIFVMRQWIRHRIGSFNEKSMRYKTAEFKYYVPEDFTEDEMREYVELMNDLFLFYHSRYEAAKGDGTRSNGRLRESLRVALPLSAYTEFVWTVNLRSLLNFLNLRMAPDAQKEIRDYANEIYGIVSSTLSMLPWERIVTPRKKEQTEAFA